MPGPATTKNPSAGAPSRCANGVFYYAFINAWYSSSGSFCVSGSGSLPHEEWSHCENGIATLEDVVRKLAAAVEDQDRRKAGKLAIVGEGTLGKPGTIQLKDQQLTLEGITQYRELLGRLAKLFEPAPVGRLIFYSCATAAGEYGGHFLEAVSSCLKDIFVIGFDTISKGSKYKSMPGQMYPHDMSEGQQTRQARVCEWSDHAKWALNGKVVQRPLALPSQLR